MIKTQCSFHITHNKYKYVLILDPDKTGYSSQGGNFITIMLHT